MQLRRGWKKNSPTWKLYMQLTQLEGRYVSGGTECAVIFLGSQASVRDLNDAEVAWLLERVSLRWLPSDFFKRANDIGWSRIFSSTLRGFGVGERDAPQFAGPLIPTVFRRLLEEGCGHCIHFHQTGASGASSSGSVHAR